MSKKNKITVSFECADKLDADQMMFAFEILRVNYDENQLLFGTTSELCELLDHMISWITAYQQQTSFEQSEITRIIIYLTNNIRVLENMKSDG